MAEHIEHIQSVFHKIYDRLFYQFFRLRRNFVPKFSAAPQFCAKIFDCAAILCQNFRLRRYFVPKFSAAPLFCAKIFGCAANLCQNSRLRRNFVGHRRMAERSEAKGAERSEARLWIGFFGRLFLFEHI